MNHRGMIARHALALCVAFVGVAHAETPATTTRSAVITGTPPTGFAKPGEPVRWTIDAPARLHYAVRRDNATVLKEGETTGEPIAVEASVDAPGWLLLDVTQPATKSMVTSAGVVLDPEHLRPAAPPPDDLRAFWRSQIEQVTAIPPNAKLVPLDSGVPGVLLYDVTLDSIDGHHVRAALARPEKGDAFPAAALFQYAGVYPLMKSSVTNLAAQGWIAINVNAHELPLYEPAAFYDSQAALANYKYMSIGNQSRETSYFRWMFCADYQALEYLTRRPDWDGKVLVARGGSQGGMQAIAMAALHPKVTAMLAAVPAGGDTLAKQVGRAEGWPNWDRMRPVEASAAIMNTSRYFDIANFAPDVHCPSLLCVGLRDTTSTPPATLSTFNAIAGPKELSVMVDGTHTANHQVGDARFNEWSRHIRRTGAPPTTQMTPPSTRPADG